MDNTQEPLNKKLKKKLVYHPKLNNFDHRDNSPINIKEPKDLITSATPAQKERIVYLVDDAIDAVESVLHAGSEKVRLAAAQDILDRAGIPKNTKTITDAAPISAIPAEAFVEFVAGLAKMFDVKSTFTPGVEPKDVTPKEALKLVKTKKKKDKNALPLDLLEQYQED